jgi:hypothetical protein
LLAGAKAAGLTDVRSSWPKPKLIEYFLNTVPFATAFEHCGGDRFVALDNTRPVEFLLYLYFGKTEDNLKNFALRDLSILRTNKASSFSARFSDREEARACFHYSHLLDRLEVKNVVNYERAAVEILDGPVCPSEYANDLRSRAACQAGQFFEKRGDAELAEKLYRGGIFCRLPRTSRAVALCAKLQGKRRRTLMQHDRGSGERRRVCFRDGLLRPEVRRTRAVNISDHMGQHRRVSSPIYNCECYALSLSIVRYRDRFRHDRQMQAWTIHEPIPGLKCKTSA